MEEADLAAVRALANSSLVQRPVRTIASAVVLASLVTALVVGACVFLYAQSKEAERWERGKVTWDEVKNWK